MVEKITRLSYMMTIPWEVQKALFLPDAQEQSKQGNQVIFLPWELPDGAQGPLRLRNKILLYCISHIITEIKFHFPNSQIQAKEHAQVRYESAKQWQTI